MLRQSFIYLWFIWRAEIAQSVQRLLPVGRPRGRISNPGEGKNFHFSMSSRAALGLTQPPIQWVRKALSPGVKRPGRESDKSPPTTADAKKTWVYTSTPPFAFTA
jgi:hypothetical protein